MITDVNVEKLAELVKERDGLAVKLAHANMDNEAIKAKLAQVQADCVAMRRVLKQIIGDRKAERPPSGEIAGEFDWRDVHQTLEAIQTGSGQALLDELDKLRETAQRRLELLRKCEWGGHEQGTSFAWCPCCQSQGHKPDCVLARELNTAFRHNWLKTVVDS